MNDKFCHIGKSENIEIWDDHEGISGATSDCKVGSKFSTLGTFINCGYPQTIITTNWLRA